MLQPNWDNPLQAALPTQSAQKPVEPQIQSTAEYDEILEALPPINPEDKRVVNGLTDVNQLAPFKYPWAWQYFLNANKNHWTPLDVNMTQDVHDYHHKLTQ